MARGAVQAVQAAELAARRCSSPAPTPTPPTSNYVCEGKQAVEVLKDIKPLAEKAAEVAGALARNGIDRQERPSKTPVAAVAVAPRRRRTTRSALVIDSGFQTAPRPCPRANDAAARAPRSPALRALASWTVRRLHNFPSARAEERAADATIERREPPPAAPADTAPRPTQRIGRGRGQAADAHAAAERLAHRPARLLPRAAAPLDRSRRTSHDAGRGQLQHPHPLARRRRLLPLRLRLHPLARAGLDRALPLRRQPATSRRGRAHGLALLRLGAAAHRSSVGHRAGLPPLPLGRRRPARALPHRVKAGAFWDRFGWLQTLRHLSVRAHAPDGRQVRIESELGTAGPSGSCRASARTSRPSTATRASPSSTTCTPARAATQHVEAGFYFLDTLSHDKRQLKEINDADMRVYGLDVRARPRSSSARSSTSAARKIAADAGDLSRAGDRDHARLRRPRPDRELPRHAGVEQRHRHACGTSAWDYTFSTTNLLRAWSPAGARFLGRSDITLGFFGVVTYVRSRAGRPRSADQPRRPRAVQVGRRRRLDPDCRGWRWRCATTASSSTSRTTPTASASSRRASRCARTGIADGEIFLQWSFYSYGARVQLRPGQVALETQPDSNAFKIQAQLVF